MKIVNEADSPSSLAPERLAADIRRGGQPGLLLQLQALHAAKESGVLGIVTRTEGSTYQKAGALVLMDRNGMRFGALSGGCLEPQVEAAAQRVLQTGRGSTIEFDTRSEDDLIYGSGTGCRGRTQLLLIPQPPGAPLSDALRSLASSWQALQLQVRTTGDATGAGSAALADRRWTWDARGIATSLAGDGLEQLSLQPPPRLLLLGAGPETLPLIAFGARLGWQLRVVEHRGRWQHFAQAAGVEDLLALEPDAAHLIWRAAQPDAALVMTHNFALDAKHLRHCAASDVGYVGLLGPAQRREALLRELGPTVLEQLGNRLHAPIGLDLGGSGPEALALSIVAEVQQYLTRAGRVR